MSTLPGSDGLYCPRWSPNGHQISATSSDGRKIKLFDLNTRTWTELAEVTTGCTAWSRDGGYVYFENLYVAQPAIFRIRIADKSRERISDLNLRLAQGLEWWSGITPDGSPIVLRDESNEEIYALDWELP